MHAAPRVTPVGLLVAVVATGACRGESTPAVAPASSADTLVTVTADFSEGFVRNFNPFSIASRWPTRAGIYEPLLIYNQPQRMYVPWLAERYEWSSANRVLTFTLRPRVLWSDGQPLTARDVVFSFNVLKDPAAYWTRLWEFLKDVRADGERTVVFEFKRPYSPGLRVVGEQPIAPAHVFERLPNPLTDPNENPVATGPFTVIKSFSPTLYEVTRNESYWQRDKVKIAGFRVPLFRGNQEAIAALMDGQVDWGSIFIPNAENAFVARDPLHNKVWYAPFGEPILLYFNTTRKPFDDKRVRKALSMSFDRGRIVKEAMNGYAPALDATGLSQWTYLPWKDFAQVKKGTWTHYDPGAAKAELESAGLRAGSDGVRRAGASPVRCTIDVTEGWNDWIAAARIIAEGMKAVGIEAELKTSPHSAWLEKVERGNFDACIAAGTGGATPYNFYRSQMASALVQPAGTRSQENWHRYGNREADAALVAFEAAADDEQRKALASKLQEIYVENAPALPLFTGPAWGEYTETRFTGFPNRENPYARLAPYSVERLLVMIELRPVKR